MTARDHDWALQPHPTAVAETFIQWKGTQVCMDFHCPCGSHGHIDADFAYFARCDACGALYELGTAVDVRRVPDDYYDTPVIARED